MHFCTFQRYSRFLTKYSLLVIVLLTIAGCEIAPKGVKVRPYEAQPKEVCEGTGCKELSSEENN